MAQPPDKPPQGTDYGNFANRLLDRLPQEEYLASWGEFLQQEKKVVVESSKGSILLFRLGTEWLGLAISVLEEVLESRPVHTVPNRPNHIFLGVVNVRGQLKLCVALHRLLEITSGWETAVPGEVERGYRRFHRMLAIKQGSTVWVFPVDEVYGALSYEGGHLLNLPTTVSKSTANYLKGLWQWNERSIAIIDEELLFAGLRRMMP